MRNPSETKQKILEVAGNLFNSKGYRATSISDITKASGLTKGAIYKHFPNKEALEKAACAGLIQKITSELGTRIRAASDLEAKLEVIYRFFEDYMTDPIVAGGCPILNGAIEADDAGVHLKSTVSQGLMLLRDTIEHILKKGITYGQLQAKTPYKNLANIFVAVSEGGLMMSKILDDRSY